MQTHEHNAKGDFQHVGWYDITNQSVLIKKNLKEANQEI
jgi:hypothetical protein